MAASWLVALMDNQSLTRSDVCYWPRTWIPVPSDPPSSLILHTFSSCGHAAIEQTGWDWEGRLCAEGSHCRRTEGNGGGFNVALRRRSVVANWLLCCSAMVYALPSHLDRPFAGRTRPLHTPAGLFVAGILRRCRRRRGFVILARRLPLPSVRIERDYEWSVSILPGSRIHSGSCIHPSIHPIAFS